MARFRACRILSDSRRLEFNKSRIKLGRIPVYSRRLAAPPARRMWDTYVCIKWRGREKEEGSRTGWRRGLKAFVLPILSVTYLPTYLPTMMQLTHSRTSRKPLLSTRAIGCYHVLPVAFLVGEPSLVCVPFFEALDCGKVTCALTAQALFNFNRLVA